MRPLLPRARPRLSPGLCRLRPESNRPVSWSAPLRPKPRRYWENLRQRGSGPPLMTDGLPTGGMSQLTDGPPMLRGSLAWLPVRRVALRCKTRAHPNAAFGRARTVAPWPRGERSGANARAATAIVTERAADHTHAHVCAQEQVRELLQGVLQSVRAWQAALSVVGEAELTALAAEAEPPRPHPAGI